MRRRPPEKSPREKLLQILLYNKDRAKYSAAEIDEGLAAFIAWHKNAVASGAHDLLPSGWLSEWLALRDSPPVDNDGGEYIVSYYAPSMASEWNT